MNIVCLGSNILLTLMFLMFTVAIINRVSTVSVSYISKMSPQLTMYRLCVCQRLWHFIRSFRSRFIIHIFNICMYKKRYVRPLHERSVTSILLVIYGPDYDGYRTTRTHPSPPKVSYIKTKRSDTKVKCKTFYFTNLIKNDQTICKFCPKLREREREW